MAVCESIAYAVRDCFQAAGLTGSVSVFGEGANSQVWGQMVADVLHRPLQIARKPEVGARRCNSSNGCGGNCL
jgi:sugar (pentulose or hexulose) kinase